MHRTIERFRLKGLSGTFLQWDAEQGRSDFCTHFDYIWSSGVIHHSAHTARIVRNARDWLTTGGTFAGIVYNRDSTQFAVALIRDWLIRGNVFSHSIDEALWRNTDGFTARCYPADQWRDLLLAFFQHATVHINGLESDYLPFPSPIRKRLSAHVPSSVRDRILARVGNFIIFRASGPF